MSRRGSGARARDDTAQATVELALALPLVALVLLLVVQVGLVVREQVLVTGAAREAARTAAVVGPDDRSAIERATARAGGLDPDRLQVAVTPSSDGTIEVHVRYRSRTDLPLVGALVPDLDLFGRAVMRRE